MSEDEAAVRGLIATFVEGWNQGSGTAIGAAFHQDAEFVAITGLKAKGRELIARGHDEILSTIYRGLTQSAEVHSVRFLGPDVALLDVTFTPSEPRFGAHQTLAGAVATREQGRWGLTMFRNAVPFGRPTAGPLDAGGGLDAAG
jgi:uncharacterized protein (TIGR02246 family)